MSSAIINLMKNTGPEIYYDPGLHTVFESHMRYLKTLNDTRVVDVDPHDVYKYESDFYGLLSKMGYPNQFHWVIMRINDITNPTNLDANLTYLIIPSDAAMSKIQQLYTTVIKTLN